VFNVVLSDLCIIAVGWLQVG